SAVVVLDILASTRCGTSISGSTTPTRSTPRSSSAARRSTTRFTTLRTASASSACRTPTDTTSRSASAAGDAAALRSKRESACVALCGSKQGESETFSTRKLHKRLHPRPQEPSRRLNTYGKAPTCGAFAEPSDGLEPSTTSFPSKVCLLRGVATGCRPALLSRFFAGCVCEGL